LEYVARRRVVGVGAPDQVQTLCQCDRGVDDPASDALSPVIWDYPIPNFGTAGGAEIGYWVVPDHWGQGIAGGVIDAAVTLTQGLDLVGRTHPDNAASRHVLQRAEFVETSRGELITYSRVGQITPAAVST
jgi:RimJ/RimL family protein N-acetyltransferase